MYRNLKALRESLNMTQAEFGQSIGLAKSTYNNYETGEREPKSDFWIAIATRYNVTIDYLMGFSMDPQKTVSGEKRKAPLYSSEAMEVAKVFDILDSHGQGAVKAILDFEHAAAVAEKRQSGTPRRPGLKIRKRSDGFVDYRVYDQPAAAGLGNYLDDPAYHIEQYPANVVPDGADFGIRISGTSMSPDIPDGCTVFVQSRSSIEPGSIGIFLLNGEAFCKKLMVDKGKGQIRLVSINKAFQDRIIEECDDFSTMGLVLGHWES